MPEEKTKCPKCGSTMVDTHVQHVYSEPGAAYHSVGWICLSCKHIWGHQGFAFEVLGY